MSVTNTGDSQGWKTDFSRKFVEFGLQVIKRGATLKFRGGYNIFDSVNAQSRSVSGYQDKVFEVQLSEEAVRLDSGDGQRQVGLRKRLGEPAFTSEAITAEYQPPNRRQRRAEQWL